MEKVSDKTCLRFGALYARTERVALIPEAGTYRCEVCNEIIEMWDSHNVPRH